MKDPVSFQVIWELYTITYNASYINLFRDFFFFLMCKMEWGRQLSKHGKKEKETIQVSTVA